MRKLRLILSLIFVLLLLSACAEQAPIHLCAEPCPACGLCLDASCAEDACTEKCQGHHECESICDKCGLCLDASCAEDACTEKCQGHHECESVCEKCGLCLDASCAEDACTEKCQGHHECESVCDKCGLCLDAECAEDTCAEKCDGHWEEPYDFGDDGYVSTSDITIDTGTFIYHIGKGIYVPSGIAGHTEAVAQTMEQVSGIDFDGNGYADYYSQKDGKIHITASRDSLYAGQDWYQGLETSEMGSAYASAFSHAVLSPGDLPLGNDYTLIHETAHVLMFRQAEWSHCQLLTEGFAEYTTYLALASLEQNDPEALCYFTRPQSCINNMSISDYKKLYEHPIEYWFENRFEYAGNANYTIGFRFMWYLNDVYGDYSKWVTEFDKLYPYRELNAISNLSEVEWQIEVLKSAYGDDVLDNFYPWLKENDGLFNTNNNDFIDLTDVGGINTYPEFNAVACETKMERFNYSDLYINIDSVRSYLKYKGIDSPSLTLTLSANVTVRLYKADGSYETVKGSRIPLDGVSYIKLVGEGRLYSLEVSGY